MLSKAGVSRDFLLIASGQHRGGIPALPGIYVSAAGASSMKVEHMGWLPSTSSGLGLVRSQLNSFVSDTSSNRAPAQCRQEHTCCSTSVILPQFAMRDSDPLTLTVPQCAVGQRLVRQASALPVG